MNKIVLEKVYESLWQTLNGKELWVREHEGFILNKLAKAYYNSNLCNVKTVYVDNLNFQAIIILNEGLPVFFYNENGEKFYQLTTINEIETYLLFILIKTIQKDYKIMKLKFEISEQKDIIKICRDDDKMMYKHLYEESIEEIEELKKKLEKKIKAYNNLKAQYETLFEKYNRDI